MSLEAPLSDLPFEGRVLSVEETAEGLAGWVEVRGARIWVNLSLVPEVRPGDRVLVQGKVALGKLEERHEVHR